MNPIDGSFVVGTDGVSRKEMPDLKEKKGTLAREARAPITNVEDVNNNYKALSSESDDMVQSFLSAFAHNNHIYGLVNTLNNHLKSIFREVRETESSIRIKKYIDQFDTALEKRDEIIEAAKEIKDKRFEAADIKMRMAITSGVMGVLSLGDSSGGGGSGAGGHLASAVQKQFEAKIDRLNAEAEELQAILQAMQAELDAEMNLERQDGDLANSHISTIDSLIGTITSMINDIHSHQSSTINALSKSIV
ncbi:hypothetical protein [Microbulbifer variabilis]|uniref:hypothetical protein n=1 Tax=Microbulbifer variabilis TaxID=266805 RepID=UPI001CFF191F|nr:hypothetical protein [Microbulbifer variabilis]